VHVLALATGSTEPPHRVSAAVGRARGRALARVVARQATCWISVAAGKTMPAVEAQTRRPFARVLTRKTIDAVLRSRVGRAVTYGTRFVGDTRARRPSAKPVFVALMLSSACGAAMRQVRVATEAPEEFWLPDAAQGYLQAQGFEVAVLENTSARIRISATREVADVRSVVFVTMQTQYYTGLADAAAQTHSFKTEIRALRYLRDTDGGWTPADPEPLRALAEELANVIKTGARA
jgi:hypothetical protein